MVKIRKFRKNGNIKSITNGIYTGLSNEKYHSTHHFSSSELKYFFGGELTPAHWKQSKVTPRKETPAMVLGTAVHTLVLEPHLFVKEYILAQKHDKRTKEGKQAAIDFEKQAAGRVILTQEQWDLCHGMAKSVKNNKLVGRLFDRKKGIAEASIFWHDESYGIDCKARPDWIYQDKIIVDLKTTENAGIEAFARTCAKFNYDLSASYYEIGFHSVFGALPSDFLFVVVERQPPHLCAVYRASMAFMLNGDAKRQMAMGKIEKCETTQTYPGHSEHIEELSLPNWAII